MLLIFIGLNQMLLAQDTISMPITGNGGFYNTCYAVIFDNGLDSNYANYSQSTVTISPLWVQNVSLYFEEFNTEVFFDSLSIYDGPGTAFPLIGTYSGNSLQGQTVTSTGTSITLEFRSDDIQTGTGFKALVSCLMGEEDMISNSIIVYPNPAQEFLKIDGLDEAIESIAVIDIQGRELQHTLVSNVLYVALLPPGFYGLQIRIKNGKVVYKKWIKE